MNTNISFLSSFMASFTANVSQGLNGLAMGLVFVMVVLAGIYMWMSPAHSQLADKADQINGPIVLELFTSQSCSSCPPADAMLGELAARDNVIALSCHVDYWDYLNWKDTQSHQFCSQRQRDYSVNQDRNARIFTPELQINGRISTVGSRGFEVDRGLDKAGQHRIKPIGMSVAQNGLVGLDLPDVTNGKSGKYDIRVYSYRHKIIQNIESGENRGKQVTYTNSVQAEFPIGAWDGRKGQITTPIRAGEIPQDGGLVAIIHDGPQGGPILAAGKYSAP